MEPIQRTLTAPKIMTFDYLENHDVLRASVNGWFSQQLYDVIYDITYTVTHRRDNVVSYSCFITYKPIDTTYIDSEIVDGRVLHITKSKAQE